MSKNVTISFDTFEQILFLLDGLDADRYGINFFQTFCAVMYELKVKMQKIELRDAYARIILAKDEDDEALARIEYLRLKSQLGKLDDLYLM
jgi:hypothetical protein